MRFKALFLVIVLSFVAMANAHAQGERTMYVLKKGVIAAEHAVTDVDSITYIDKRNSPYYDEGVVINGIKWATRNVGAPGTFANNPEDAGMLFQFNSRTGWRINTWPPISSDGSSLNRYWWYQTATQWDSSNDPCPEGWRIPSIQELYNLHQYYNNRDGDDDFMGWTTTPADGINFGTADNLLFLPYAGSIGVAMSGDPTNNPNPGYWCNEIASNKIVFLTFSPIDVLLNSLNSYPVGSCAFCIRCVAK